MGNNFKYILTLLKVFFITTHGALIHQLKSCLKNDGQRVTDNIIVCPDFHL